MLLDPDGYEEDAFSEEDGNITNDKVGKPLSSAHPLASASGNPHPGRSGGTAHKSWVKQLLELLKVMYPDAYVKTEAKVVAENGKIRYGDVGVYFPGSSSPYLVAQVGKSLMSGNPVARERRAIADITGSGVYVLYFAYDRSGPAMFYHP